VALLATEKEEDGQGGCHWWLLVGIGAAGGQAVETRWSDWWRWQGARLVVNLLHCHLANLPISAEGREPI